MIKTLKTNLQILLSGMAMGIAEILPGISGSTIAIVIGIYDNFIAALSFGIDLVKTIVRDTLKFNYSHTKTLYKENKALATFTLILPIGMLISIISLSHIVEQVIVDYPQQITALFLGLILVSIPIPFREIKNIKYIHFVTIGISAVVAFLILGFSGTGSANISPNPILLFFGGILGISGMILPGISGSYILYILNLYEYVISSIKEFSSLNFEAERLLNMGVFIVGLAFGAIFFVKLLKYAITRFPNITLSIIVGLMVGSLRALYPFFVVESSNGESINKIVNPATLDTNVLIGIILSFLGGVLLIVVMQHFAKVDKSQFSKIGNNTK